MKQSISGGRCGRRFSHGFFLLFAAALTVLSSAAFAQREPISVLITASRFAETADSALAPVSVITSDDIEKMQAKTVNDVLRTVPGLAITQNGGTGQLASLFMRGTESNHVLFLIDGISAGGASSGQPPIQHLSLDQIERIEVVRGPRSSLYGPQAIGGVVQIFTKRGGEERTTADIAAGSHRTAKSGVGISGGGERGWYRFGTSAYSTSGFDVCRGSPTGGGFSCGVPDNEDDRDGHNNRTISFNTGMKAGRFSVEGSFLNSDNEAEFDGDDRFGPAANSNTNTVRNSAVKANMRISQFWNASLNAGEAQNLSDNFNKGDGSLNSRTNNFRETASWQNDFTLSERHRIIAGFDQLKDRIDGTTNYATAKVDNTGGFLSWRVAADGLDVEASVRGDDHSAYGEHSTGGIAFGTDLGNAHRMIASYGTGFSPPTLFELHSASFGNPNLDPEESETFDVGFSGRNLGVDWTLNAFRTQTENLITFDFARGPGNYYQNVDVALSRGVEFTGNMAFWGWNFQTNLTAQEPKVAVGDANVGKRLARRAKTLFNFDMARDFGAFSLGASVHGQSASFDDAANTRRLSGYGVADLRGEMRLLRNWTLGLRVNNIFDKQYETVLYYPQDGTNFLLTLRYDSGAR